MAEVAEITEQIKTLINGIKETEIRLGKRIIELVEENKSLKKRVKMLEVLLEYERDKGEK
jgi:hypothetical protein